MRPKPHRLEKPGVVRLPIGRRMTIVIGMLHSEGVIVAADSEETTGDNIKGSVQKIAAYESGKVSAMIGGAGPDHQVETVTASLADQMAEIDSRNFAEKEKALGAIVEEQYKAHVLNWPTAAEREDNDFSLIVGLTVRQGKTCHDHLYVAQKGMLRPLTGHYAIGTGASYARVLLERYRTLTYDHPFWSSCLLAAYIVQKVKRDVPYCGKHTSLSYTWNGMGSHICWMDIEKAEETFDRLDEFSARQFLWALTGEKIADGNDVFGDIHRIGAEFEELVEGDRTADSVRKARRERLARLRARRNLE